MKLSKLFVAILILLSSSVLYATKVYEVDADYKADWKVFVVDADYKADLKVYLVDADYKAEGNEGLWYFVDADYKADKKVYFVDADYKADVKIFYVDADYKAGWNETISSDPVSIPPMEPTDLTAKDIEILLTDYLAYDPTYSKLTITELYINEKHEQLDALIEVVARVVEGSASEDILEPEDWILALNHEPFESWDAFISTIIDNPGEPILFTILRSDHILNMTITPQDKNGEGKIGVVLDEYAATFQCFTVDIAGTLDNKPIEEESIDVGFFWIYDYDWICFDFGMKNIKTE